MQNPLYENSRLPTHQAWLNIIIVLALGIVALLAVAWAITEDGAPREFIETPSQPTLITTYR